MPCGLSRNVTPAAIAMVLVVVPASVFAQQAGIKAGVNSASLTPSEDEDPDTSRRIGPIGGVWVRLTPARRVAFQVEGLFSEKGVKFRAPLSSADDSFDVRVRYLEFPLLARAAFGASGARARAYVVGGAAPAFKLSARGKSVVAGEEHITDVGDEVYAVDLGLVGGVGVEFGRALVEARYTHGLRHINTDDNGDEDRIRNRVFSVMAGFRLR